MSEIKPGSREQRNAQYLTEIDEGIAQLEAGKGQIHELIENDVLADTIERLEKVKSPYEGFVRFTIEDIDLYRSKNPNILEQLHRYLIENDDLTSSEVCEYMRYLIGLPYSEDGIWYRWDKVITEEEAQRIVDEEYSE